MYAAMLIQVELVIRPYTYNFLENVSKSYNIVVYSHLTKRLGQKLVKKLDPNKEWISESFFRNSLVRVKTAVYLS